ncbi:MAG: amino acid permease [Deltaproteobacteria bacterium]|nr:amino acid permease [Deltaproteobacteria bacterium]
MKRSTNSNSMPGNAAAKLGTFGGVFTPSILTILGIILFLRLGYVVGSAGLGKALLIIALANTISILTSVSLSAIATNLKVRGGGDYYLISRTLGVEFGGAIGVVLFLAQSVSIAFYCIGMGEAVAGMFSETPRWLPQVLAAAAVAVLFVFAWLGADWATRFQYVIMIIMTAAIISFYAGALGNVDGSLLVRNLTQPEGGPPFWVIFAIFFPAVTGFTQGVSMSGDLKDPGKSLPLGTFAAVGISIVIYFTVALIFAAVLPLQDLSGDYGAMKRVATAGWLINAGVIAATVSSAMASFLGAPRILQSMAKDRIFSFLIPFAEGWGPMDNPRRGVILSCIIALVTVALGNLNMIAPVVSMFFLISYGLLNYATYYESRAGSPSFRPTFRWFDQRLSLLGALACLGVMLSVNFIAGCIAGGVLFGIYQYLQRTAGPARWADSKNAYHFKLMRDHLLAIPETIEHPRDWRPQILAFSDDPERRKCLLRFASWVEGKSGITTAVKILEGRGKKMEERRAAAEEELRADIVAEGIDAFVKVITAADFRTGAELLVQSFGIGPVKPNTILLNGPEQLRSVKEQKLYGRYLTEAIRMGCNVLVLHVDDPTCGSEIHEPSKPRHIDVWWRDDATGRLMLLLAYLMTRTEDWETARIRLHVASSPEEAGENKKRIGVFLDDVRIAARIMIVEKATIDRVVEDSTGASMVFLPLAIGKKGPAGPYGVHLETIFSKLSTVVLVTAAEDIDLEALPEEGPKADLAAARDRAADAEKKAREMEKQASEAVAEGKDRIAGIRTLLESEEDTDKRKELEKAVKDIEDRLKEAESVASEARREAEEAAAALEELDGHPPAESSPGEARPKNSS